MPAARPIPWSMYLRQAHTLLGMLIAPSVLLFAVTGGFQIFRLNEDKGSYTPPALLADLARVHKNQVLKAAPRAPRVEAPDKAVAARAPVKAEPEREKRARPAPSLSKILLQWFFVVVSVGLFLSTSVGIWMGVTMGRLKVAARWTLLAGTLIPVLILLIP
ncbi:hypothetical protein [Brevundimonas subvibrioides]|uniref:hypothetical protein n=1 Tax=Brevundimonas subvibrioides TaxID=74313 RepID=UPI0022B57641|nr:hypothetical protein [Brevundimonas subvibrioides]